MSLASVSLGLEMKAKRYTLMGARAPDINARAEELIIATGKALKRAKSEKS